MKLIVQLKLIPSSEQATGLTATLRACNRAANQVSEIAFARRVFRNYRLRRLTYARLRADGLDAAGRFTASEEPTRKLDRSFLRS